jgi:hypothetical protein
MAAYLGVSFRGPIHDHIGEEIVWILDASEI